jgi:predicted HTH transcriptional regulator
MDTDELESHLQGQTETPTLEFKGAVDWNADRMVKDFLAMSNIQEGGIIIIGIEDGTLARQGVTGAQMVTYRADVMRDQLAQYTDPNVRFTVHFPTDRNGVQFVAIKISPFEDVPIICKRDGGDVHAGTVYYRSKHRRPESAAVANSYDMRDILEVATVKRMQRLKRLGLDVGPTADQPFNDELGGL